MSDTHKSADAHARPSGDSVDHAHDYGPTRDSVTPPVDARVVVTVSGYRVSVFTAESGRTVRIHTVERRNSDLASYDGTGHGTDRDVDDLPGPHAETTLSTPAWVTVSVDGVRRCRVGGAAGETVRLHLAPTDRPTERGVGA